MNSAQQYLSFRVTNAAVGRWRLTVPGDVEIKSGANVVSRVVDEAAKLTRFELLPGAPGTPVAAIASSDVAEQPPATQRAGRRLALRAL